MYRLIAFGAAVFVYLLTKLRSGVSVGMNPDTKAIKRGFDSLGDMFKQGEILMAYDNCNNCDKATEIISNVNSTYDKLIFLCSTISESDVLAGTSLTRLDVDERYWNFKLKAKQWLESFSDCALGEQAQIVSESKVSSQAEVSRIYTVSKPKLAKLLPSKESGISELSKMPLSASEPRSQDQRHFSPFVSGLNESNERSSGTVTKSASKNSRIYGSKSDRTSASFSKKREALIKLELARQQKAHNEERIREEQEIEHLLHLKLIADDQRRVEAAELEAALYHSDATEDKFSSCEEKLLEFPKIERDVADHLNRLSVLMKRCCYSLADDRVASSLVSVTFPTAIVSKFPLDLKRKWVETTVQISNKFSRLATFKDLALFVEEQTRIANSVFGLKLFFTARPKAINLRK